jgi:Holliday junction resolvase
VKKPFYEKTEKESNLQSEIIEHAHRRGWFAQKVVFDGRRGCPDVVAIRRGRTVWIEVKREGDDLRRQQALVAREMREHGAEVFGPVDNIRDAMEILK